MPAPFGAGILHIMHKDSETVPLWHEHADLAEICRKTGGNGEASDRLGGGAEPAGIPVYKGKSKGETVSVGGKQKL